MLGNTECGRSPRYVVPKVPTDVRSLQQVSHRGVISAFGLVALRPSLDSKS